MTHMTLYAIFARLREVKYKLYFFIFAMFSRLLDLSSGQIYPYIKNNLKIPPEIGENTMSRYTRLVS